MIEYNKISSVSDHIQWMKSQEKQFDSVFDKREWLYINDTVTQYDQGTSIIETPMTFNNMMKKLDRGKGAVISMSGADIEQNKMEGTGLFAGSGKKSGKISRIKKARKWRDFSDDTLRKGIDTARYGYEQYKEATNPLQAEERKH